LRRRSCRPWGGCPFYYQRLNRVRDGHRFDAFVGPSAPVFRGIAWRTADSLALRGFLGFSLDEIASPALHEPLGRALD
jgi:hypothetical protein